LNAKTKVYTAVNYAMVEAYWEIGRQIIAAQGQNQRVKSSIEENYE